MKTARNMGTAHKRLVLKHISGSLGLLGTAALAAGIGTGALLWPTTAEAQRADRPGFDRHHPLIQRAIDVKRRYHHALVRIPDVLGTAVSVGPNKLPAIKVYTRIPGVQGIPEWLDSTPVQVEVTGMIVALGTCPQGYCVRPVPIGVSTGHPAITAGTIGARITDGHWNYYVLSNNHVLAASNNAKIGDSALQPGPYDSGGKEIGRDEVIGTLYAFRPIDFSVFGSNIINAAIAITGSPSAPSKLDYETLNDGYGSPKRNTVTASQGLLVKKYGRTTFLTHGTISDIDATISVCYANCSSDLSAKLARFDDQFGITGNPDSNNGIFSSGGDSGSLIVTDDTNPENNNKPVGLLFAGSDTRTFANPIDAVLRYFCVTVDDGSVSGAEPPIAPSNLTATPLSRSQIRLSWTDNSSDEQAFDIESCKGTGCSNFAVIATVGPNVTTYTNTGLSGNTTYTYRVRSYNTHCSSSNTKVAKTNP